jgi:hypothetical protein
MLDLFFVEKALSKVSKTRFLFNLLIFKLFGQKVEIKASHIHPQYNGRRRK